MAVLKSTFIRGVRIPFGRVDFLGCGFRLALPTGDVGVPGVDDVAVKNWRVGPWLEVFYCVVLLVGSRVSPLVEHLSGTCTKCDLQGAECVQRRSACQPRL